MASPLDDLICLMPWGELGYNRYHEYLLQNPDYGYLINQRRVISKAGGYTHSQPAELLKLALEGKNVPSFKRVLWLEHDHKFPLDVFQRHARYAEPVVSGLYVWREVENPVPVVYKWDEGRQNAFFYNAVELEQMGVFDEMDSPRRRLHKVDVVPMGCLSVRRDVYETWPEDRPFFTSYTQPIGSHDNLHVSTVGHDVYACRIMQDAGWPIHIDTSLRVKHYALIELDDTYFAKWYRLIRQPQAIEELAEVQPKLRIVQ